MKAIAVDDEQLALDSILLLMKEVAPEAEVRCFLYSDEMLDPSDSEVILVTTEELYFLSDFF